MYYLIGIKGSGMSALASILYDLGYEVAGSDVEKHFFTEEGLAARNIKILPYDEKNIKEGMIIIRGNAIKDDHPEILKASHKIRIANGSGRTVTEVNTLLKRFESMQQMMKQFKNGNFKMPF